jgi:6-phosphofructokinase 1
MGRNCGYLALVAGIAGGAEVVVIPEIDSQPEDIVADLGRAYERGHAHAIAVVAEGAHYNADALAHYFSEHSTELEFELRITKLGHVERGGPPGAFDRLLATQLGAAAFDHVARRQYGVLVGIIGGKLASTPLPTVITNKKEVDSELITLARVLAI